MSMRAGAGAVLCVALALTACGGGSSSSATTTTTSGSAPAALEDQMVDIGGHNILEPAALGKPILTGPSLYNFAEICEKLLAVNAMKIVNNADELADNVVALFANETLRMQIGLQALQVVEANRGALRRDFVASTGVALQHDCSVF